jgi:hypothetical protein
MERSARRALFTDLESGKARASSGSRSTTLVPARKRSTYLPRTPPKKSYSGLISTAALLERGLFVFAGFRLCCSASADQSRPLSSHSMNHDREPSPAGHSNGDETILLGMIGVRNRNRKRIAKYDTCLGKSNTVFAAVRPFFSRVPLEHYSYHAPLSLANSWRTEQTHHTTHAFLQRG